MENNDFQQVRIFDDLDLKHDLLRGIYSYGYETPSDLQRRAIPAILQGFDVIVQAHPCSGKSASLLISILQSIDEDIQECQALILAPTIYLAQQLSHLMKRLADFLKVSIDVCEKSSNIEGRQVLIGTPEMIFKKLKQGSLKMNALRIVAVDKADKVVPQEAMKGIFKYMDENIQVVMFATTLPEDVLETAKKYTTDPVMTFIEREESSLERITHIYMLVDEAVSKSETLAELLFEKFSKNVILLTMTSLDMDKILIFCNEKETVNEVAEVLSKNFLRCSKIDETMELQDREAALEKLRAGESRVLVTTCSCSKGVDIPMFSYAFNLEWPLTKEEYGNRIGRFNQFNKGFLINIVTPTEAKQLRELEKYYGIKFKSYFDYFS